MELLHATAASAVIPPLARPVFLDTAIQSATRPNGSINVAALLRRAAQLEWWFTVVQLERPEQADAIEAEAGDG
jgi:hypothetical protein